MATATWIKNTLDKRGVAYEERHHRVAFTAQEVAQSEHISGHHLAKVVVAIADEQPVELILPATRRVLLDRVRTLLGAERVRLASEAEMDKTFIDCESGAIPPLRHWKDVTVLMDASLSTAGELVFQAGTHEDAISMKFQDWLALVSPRVEFFTEPEHPSSSAIFRDRGDVEVERFGRAAKTAGAAPEPKHDAGQPAGGQPEGEPLGHVAKTQP